MSYAQAGNATPQDTPKFKSVETRIASETHEISIIAQAINGLADRFTGSDVEREGLGKIAPGTPPKPVPNGAVESLFSVINDLSAIRETLQRAVRRLDGLV
jgi:hypothetical protein